MDEFDTSLLPGKMDGKDRVLPRFFVEAVQNNFRSKEESRPIYDDIEMVELIIAGDKNNRPVEVVTDEHRARYKTYYDRFKQGLEFAAEGTPVEHWSLLSKGQALELKAMKLFTVEQVADVSDQALPSLGLGGRTIRDNARAWLSDAKDSAVIGKIIAERDRALASEEELKGQLKGMGDRLEELERKLNLERAKPREREEMRETYDPAGVKAPVAAAEREVREYKPRKTLGLPTASA